MCLIIVGLVCIPWQQLVSHTNSIMLVGDVSIIPLYMYHYDANLLTYIRREADHRSEGVRSNYGKTRQPTVLPLFCSANWDWGKTHYGNEHGLSSTSNVLVIVVFPCFPTPMMKPLGPAKNAGHWTWRPVKTTSGRCAGKCFVAGFRVVPSYSLV